MIVECRLISYHSDDYKQMIALRTEILRKPLGLTYTQAQLDIEVADNLICAFIDQQLIGCCILTALPNKQMQLRQMAVANNFQVKGIGANLINFAENLTLQKGFNSITLHARLTAKEFYQKQGYMPIGEEFTEVNLPHIEMEKQLF